MKIGRSKFFKFTFATLLLFGLSNFSSTADLKTDPDDKKKSKEKSKADEMNISTALLIKPSNISVKAKLLSDLINSPYVELKPNLDPTGNTLYFSRYLHPDNTNGDKDYEDIWYTSFDEISNTWSEPTIMPAPLNNAGPNFINNISPSGDTLILGNTYYRKGKMRSGLSYSTKVDGEWTSPKNIYIMNYYNLAGDANHFMTGGVILSSIEREDTKGSRDLYVSFWDGYDATEPINLGEVLNTEFEESSPFMASDNKTLYFASKGHDGYGGFDIYKSERLDDTWTKWSEPKNLGAAVNSKLDEEYFSVNSTDDTGFFARKLHRLNVDLYLIAMDSISRDSRTPKHQGM